MEPITLTTDNFDNEVVKSDKPVLIDFWAVWCGPCKIIAPVVEELAQEYDGKIKVGKLNVDENPQIAIRFGVRSIPTLLIFNNGELKHTIIGTLPKAHIVQKLNTVL